MINSVRKTPLNTLQFQKIACGGYFTPNPTGSLDSLVRNSRAKGALSMTPWLGRFKTTHAVYSPKKSNCILENVSLNWKSLSKKAFFK